MQKLLFLAWGALFACCSGLQEWKGGNARYHLERYTHRFSVPHVPHSIAAKHAFLAYNYAIDAPKGLFVSRVSNANDVRHKMPYDPRKPPTSVINTVHNFLLALDVRPESLYASELERNESPTLGREFAAVLPFSFGGQMLFPLFEYMEQAGVPFIGNENNGVIDPLILTLPGEEEDDLFLLVQLERAMFQGVTTMGISHFKQVTRAGKVHFSHVHTICLRLPGPGEWSHQKNWTPLVTEDHIDFVTHVYPKHVVHRLPLEVVMQAPTLYNIEASSVPVSVWEECVPSLEAYSVSIAYLHLVHHGRSFLPNLDSIRWHGGKSVVEAPSFLPDRYLVMIHTRPKNPRNNKRLYSFAAMRRDFPFQIVAMTPLFLFDTKPSWVQYCSSLWLSPDRTHIQGGVSFNDTAVGVVSVPLSEVVDWLAPLSGQ